MSDRFEQLRQWHAPLPSDRLARRVHEALAHSGTVPSRSGLPAWALTSYASLVALLLIVTAVTPTLPSDRSGPGAHRAGVSTPTEAAPARVSSHVVLTTQLELRDFVPVSQPVLKVERRR